MIRVSLSQTRTLGLVCLSVLASLALTTQTLAQQIFGVVVAESTALRVQPDPGARLVRWARAGEEFQWLVGSWNEGPARVAFSAPFRDTVWVNAGDTYIEWSVPTAYELDVRLSLFEVPEGTFGERVPPARYLETFDTLPPRYWIDATFAPYAKSHFGVVAHMYKPAHYFLYAKDKLERSPFRDSLYDSLFDRAVIRPLYRFTSVWRVATIRERLVLTRRIVDHDSCYDSNFVRTESRTLVDTVRTVNDYHVEVTHPIATSLLWNRTPDGEPSGMTLTYYLEVTPATKRDGPPSKRIARSILLGWASCL